MSHVRKFIRSCYLSLSVLLMVMFFPAMAAPVFADSSTTCTPPSPTTPGVHWPTGSSAGTFTYQCSGPYSGEWTNQYYAFNPSTDTQTPLYSPDYSYNCTTGLWYQNEYDYDAANGSYVLNRVQASNPGLPTNCPVVATNSVVSDPTNSGIPDSSSLSSQTNGASDPSGISNTGPSSTNASSGTLNNNLNLNNNSQATMTNGITQNSSSGNAQVIGNTTAGSATSGAAQSEANIINMLQSSSNVLGTGKPVMTFTANINGDVNGNLLIDPNALASVQNTGPSSVNTSTSTTNNNLTVNNSNGAAINNNINLASNSGNATVADNTTGGNATSGAAETIANVVNTIDSAIEAGQSFIGTININGNLNGDILLPPNLVNQLLADNVPTVTLTGPSSSNGSNTTVNNNATVNNTNNLGINNNVNAMAGSGNATVSHNTSGGNATSGSAKTTITAFNLTGSNIIGSNDILVFVNVTGSWVGLILNAPPGTTAAEFGGGISSTGPNSSNTSSTTVNNNATINSANNDQINNNITTSAKSGNALVNDNTHGGNATSGNAENAVNLANIENSSFNLTGWFGILFINVFGNWHGNFGISPEATSNVAANSGAVPAYGFAVFHFMPTSGASENTSGSTNSNVKPNALDYSTTPLYGFVNNYGGNNDLYPSYSLLASSSKKAAQTAAPKLQEAPRGNIARTAEIIGTCVLFYILLDAAFTNRRSISSRLRR